MAFGRKKKPAGSEVEAAWDDYVARPETWSSRDLRAVEKVAALAPDHLGKLKKALATTVDEVMATQQPLPALREAIMDATDRFVLAERLHGADSAGEWPADLVEGILEAGALRRFAKAKFKDVAENDWYAHYLQVVEMNSRNVTEMIRKTVTGEQTSLEDSLHEPLTRTMQRVREALLTYPPRVPVTRADDLLSAKTAIRLTPNRDQIDGMTSVMTHRFEMLFAGQLYRLGSGPALNPTGTFQVDAGLLYTMLALHFRHPSDAWREIMNEALGPYRAAMQSEEKLLRIGEELYRAWQEIPGGGPLSRVLDRAHGIAFGSDSAAAGIDAATFAAEASEDASVLIGHLLKIIEER